MGGGRIETVSMRPLRRLSQKPIKFYRPVGEEATHHRLIRHPNFRLPRKPKKSAPPEAWIEWALEAAARYVSPPKVLNEHDEFRCEDIADALREGLATMLVERLEGKV